MGMKLGGGPGSEEADAEIMAEINITPLTDIFLVLLIIFMVTSSVMAQLGVDVDLPQASQALVKTQDDAVVVTLLKNGALQIADVKIGRGNWEHFREILIRAFEKTNSRLVVLEGDRKAYLGAAIELMDHARQAGAAQFAIATSPEE